MSTYTNLDKIYNSSRKFLTSTDFASLLGIEVARTLEDTLKRLIDGNIITQLEKGKYFITNKKPTDFEIANFLCSPSYISFETALNFHGILSQFPYETTSVTTKKGVEKIINEKPYTYSQINKQLFTGYYKDSGYLIAYPEKALFDQLYMICKSLRSGQYLDEMDYSSIRIPEFEKYLELVPTNYSQKMKLLLKDYL